MTQLLCHSTPYTEQQQQEIFLTVSIYYIYLFAGGKKIFHCNNDRDFFTEKGENIYFLFYCWSRFPFRWFSSSFALVYLFTYFYRRFLVNFIYFSRKALRRKMISIPPVDLSSTRGKKKRKRIHDDFIWVYLCFAISVFFNTVKKYFACYANMGYSTWV